MIEDKLNWIKQSANLILDAVSVAMNSLEKEKKEKTNKVWVVYWLDEVWVLDRDTIRIYGKREDAYKYYKDLAGDVLEGYRENNDRLKRPNVISDFTEHTYFTDNNYPEFWIDNKKNWECHIWFEYEECILREYFIL